MVADVIQETPDTTTLVFFTGNEHLEYRAGHFLTIDAHQFDSLRRFTAYLEDLKGKREPARAYSLASAPHEKYVSITVKEELYVSKQTPFPPLLSPMLVRQVSRGQRMVITGFTGPYFLPDDIESRTDHVVHIVAGSGAVPNFAIVKDALHRNLKLRHTFLCSNKTREDIVYRDALAQLEKTHPGKVRVLHTLTRETGAAAFGPGYREGRVTRQLLEEAMPDKDHCLVYACGPAIGPYEKKAAREKGIEPAPRFLEGVLQQLSALGVPKERIHHESWG
jgi:3-ketosteroid 9alpha-monooxygenase subunit B